MKHYDKSRQPIGRSLNFGDNKGKKLIVDKREKPQELMFIALSNRSAIQRTGNFSASVSLSVPQDENFQADGLKIDTIKLTGRTDTGLKKNGDKTQGDHIIADTFIKSYQKVMLRDKPIIEALEFYDMCFNVISQQQQTIPFVSESLVSEDIQKKRKSITESEMQNGVDRINAIKGGEFPMYLWRKYLVDIISHYNEAYSHSKAATIYNDSRPIGKGEAAKKKKIKNLFLKNEAFNYSDYPTMIDEAAVYRAEYDINYFNGLYQNMLEEMYDRYREHKVMHGEMITNGLQKPLINDTEEHEYIKNDHDVIKSICKNISTYTILFFALKDVIPLDNTVEFMTGNLQNIFYENGIPQHLTEDGSFLSNTINRISSIQSKSKYWFAYKDTAEKNGNTALGELIDLAVAFIQDAVNLQPDQWIAFRDIINTKANELLSNPETESKPEAE